MKKITYLSVITLFSLSFYSQVNKSTTKENNNNSAKLKQQKAKVDINKINENNSNILTGKPELGSQNPVYGIPKRSYAVDWIKPNINSNEKITLFSKIELGVNIPDSLQQKINAFINDEDGKDKINPFDSDEFNIVANFEYLLGKEWKFANKRYAFYFQDYNRVTDKENIQSWTWEKIKTNTPFRIRYSPNRPGKWRVLVIVYYRGKEQARMGEFEFSCLPGKNKDFVKISNDKKSFAINRESFLPIGQNLLKPSCYIFKDKSGNIVSDIYSCSKLPCAGKEEFCTQNRELPLHPKAYTTYLEEINNLKMSGANSFRMSIFPYTYEIEFEKIGNYSNRLHCAWELDKVIETAENDNLKVNINLFSSYSVSRLPSELNHWDWYKDGNNDIAYCYSNDLKLKEPMEFLTNPNAKKHFKNRLRYYISRYGYSTSIAWWELINEVNKTFPNNPKDVYSWNSEMLSYLKKELDCQQLLSLNYDENGPDEKNGDLSFTINNLDILSLNVNNSQNTIESVCQKVYKYNKILKPLVFSEYSIENLQNEFCFTRAEWLKNLWQAYFVGTASAGFNSTLQHDYEVWKKMNNVRTFFMGANLNYFPTIEYDTRADKLAEIIVRKDTSNTKAMGIIYNLTWNSYTQPNDNSCKQSLGTSKEQQKFVSVQSGKKKKALSLVLKANKEYFLEWYDPFEGKIIDTLTTMSNIEGQVVLDHPTLNEKLPFVTFKCYSKNNPIASKNTRIINKVETIDMKSKSNENQNKGKLEDK